jgi:hypothetical protein
VKSKPANELSQLALTRVTITEGDSMQFRLNITMSMCFMTKGSVFPWDVGWMDEEVYEEV